MVLKRGNTVVVNNDSKVESVTVSKGGRGYTYGTLDLKLVVFQLERLNHSLMSSFLLLVVTVLMCTENWVDTMFSLMLDLRMTLKIQILSLVTSLLELVL